MSSDSISTPARVGALGYALVCLLPLATLVVHSWAGAWRFPALIPAGWTSAIWHRAVGGDFGLLHSLAVSAGIGALVAGVTTTAGFFASHGIARLARPGPWLLAAHIPFALSPVILGTCLLFLFIKLGLAGSLVGVVAGQGIFAFGYATLLLTGFWNPQVFASIALARTLGGNRYQVFLRVTLPLARPWLALALFQTFLLSWFDYGLTSVVGGGKVPSLTLKVFEYLSSGNVGLAAAAACLLIVPPLALLLGPRPRNLRFETYETTARP